MPQQKNPDSSGPDSVGFAFFSFPSGLPVAAIPLFDVSQTGVPSPSSALPVAGGRTARTAAAARPEALGGRRPVLRVVVALSAQVIGGFRRLRVGRVRAGPFDDLAQPLRVFKHRARAQHVVVERLRVVIGHEDRGAQRVEQADLADVRVGIVDEHTGIDVAVRVDVQVAAAACDASANVFAVVLEVHGEDRLGRADFADAVVHVLALLRAGQQLRCGVVADGHVVEVPDEARAEAADEVDERLRGDGIDVGAGVAGGKAEGQVLVVQDLHGAHGLLIDAVAAPPVGDLLKALQTDGGDEVLHAQHLVGERLVDQRAVGEGEELAVAVLFAQGDQVLFAHERLAAGVDVHVDAHLLALRDDRVDLLEGQVQLVAVLRGPAAGAVQVAGRGRVEQDGPRDVAVVRLAQLLLNGPADDVGVEEEVGECSLWTIDSVFRIRDT